MYQYSRHLFLIHCGGSICQSRFIYQVLCTGIQGISALLPRGGGPPAKVGLSAKFGVAVFKAYILGSLGGSICQSRFVCQVLCTGIQGISALLPRRGPLAKEGSSAKFGVVYSKHLFSIHCGGPSAKVCSSAKFGVAVFKVSILNSLGVYCLSRFVCQVLCTGIQGISALLPRGAICQSRFICQVLCTGIQGISVL